MGSEEEDEVDISRSDSLAQGRCSPKFVALYNEVRIEVGRSKNKRRSEPTQEYCRPTQSEVWVDKYAPKKYVDLLSEEQVNFDVVDWIRKWDEFVFNRPVPERKTYHKKFMPQKKDREKTYGFGAFGQKKELGQEKEKEAAPFAMKTDQERKQMDTRPPSMILLLHGKAGVGKTTLAHITARHTGYNPIEVNASLTRTIPELRNTIISAVSGQATLTTVKDAREGGKPRPSLLILDEVDGLASHSDEKSVAKFLISLANAPLPKAGKGGEDEDGKKKRKRKEEGGGAAQHRPIICICNDLYTPSLRELRNVAVVINVPDIPLSRTTARVQEICKLEGVRNTEAGIRALCDVAGGDLRSVLNNLQFLKASTTQVTPKAVEALGSQIGHKDQNRALFPMWEDIFVKLADRTAYYHRLSKLGQDGKATLGELFRRAGLEEGKGISSMVDNSVDPGYHYVALRLFQCSDWLKLWEGCFENFLNVRYADIRLEKTSSLLDQCSCTDRILKARFERQAPALNAYLHSGIMRFYLECGTNRRLPKIVFPRKQLMNKFTMAENRDIIKAWTRSLSGEMQSSIWGQGKATALDYIGLGLVILSPKLRVASFGMRTDAEKRAINELAAKYAKYEVSYGSQPRGTKQAWVLEPELDRLLTFEKFGKDFTTEFQLPTEQFRQVISREVRFVKIREESKKLKGQEEEGDRAEKQREREANFKRGEANVSEAFRMHEEREAAKKAQASQKKVGIVRKDLFGREIRPSQSRKRPRDEGSPTLAELALRPASSPMARSPSGTPRSGDASPRATDFVAPPEPKVRFVYHEGFTNAVKKSALTSDFV